MSGPPRGRAGTITHGSELPARVSPSSDSQPRIYHPEQTRRPSIRTVERTDAQSAKAHPTPHALHLRNPPPPESRAPPRKPRQNPAPPIQPPNAPSTALPDLATPEQASPTATQYRRDGITYRPARDASPVPVHLIRRRHDPHPATHAAAVLLTGLYAGHPWHRAGRPPRHTGQNHPRPDSAKQDGRVAPAKRLCARTARMRGAHGGAAAVSAGRMGSALAAV